MKDRNADRSGYKKTKAGWIPEEWECIPAGSLFDIQLGKMLNQKARNGENPQPYLANYNVRWGEFDLSQVQEMSFYEKELYKFELQQGDLLVCEGGEVGRCAVWEEQIKPCYFQKALHRVRPSSEDIDVYYIMYYLHHAVSSPMMVNFVGQSSISHFTREQFLKFPIALPSLAEQKKIAEILSNWDACIDQARKLITAKKNRKRALMQQLLTGNIRLGGEGRQKKDSDRYPADWPIVKLEDLFAQVKRKNKANSNRVLTASGRYGLIAQYDYFNRSVAGQSLYNYYLLKNGEYAYNRSSMNGYKYGAIKRLDKYKNGILSTLYVCFRLKDKACDSDFYMHFFNGNMLDRDLRAIAQVGARAHGLLNITLHDFFSINIPKPPYQEQRSIAKILTAAENEIIDLEKNLKGIEKQKRGLMQKLLTGEVRVKT
jgi:type I restriction enzyme S subunit